MPGRAANLDQVRAALAAYLDTGLPGVTAWTYARGTIDPPAIVVTPAPGTFVNYQVTLDDAVGYVMRLVILVSQADIQTGTAALDGFLANSGETSIPALIRADPTLGGLVDYTVVTIGQRYGSINYGGVEYLAAEVIVEVAAP